MLNPLAPVPLQGVFDAPFQGGPGFADASFSYVYNATLTPNQFLQNQVVPVFAEADFMWRALQFTSTGVFAVRFLDGQGYYLSDGMIWSTNLPNSPGDPFPFFPEVPYPAAGRIQLEIQDLSNAANILQLLFVGANRYPVMIPATQ
jgi:hypothetical protein